MELKVIFIFVLFPFLFGCTPDNKIDTISIHTYTEVSWEEKRVISVDYIHKGDTLMLPAKAKFRGGYSSAYYKHSFSVELENDFPLVGLPMDDDWIFNASYIDKTLMRHKICFDLFRAMSTENLAPQSAYFNLLINDEYEGLYVLMEKVNAGFLGLNKSDSMAMLFKDPPVFRKDRVVQEEQPKNPHEQKYPNIEKRNFSSILDSLQDYLLYSDQSDIEENISKILDIENVIDWHLLLLFTNNGDGIKKNFYLYKTDGQSPFRIAIWDYDHSFGRDGDNQMNMMTSPLDCGQSILFTRLTAWPRYTEMLNSRYSDLRNNGLFSVENIQSMIEENDDIISNEITENFVRWPVTDEWYQDHNTYNQEKELIVQFVKMRIEQLDEQFGYLR